jgi:hypothetical protein
MSDKPSTGNEAAPDPRDVPAPAEPPASAAQFGGDAHVAAFAEKLCAWFDAHGGNKKAMSIQSLAADYKDTMQVAPKTEFFGTKGRKTEDFKDAWMLGQRNRACFLTSPHSSKLKSFRPPPRSPTPEAIPLKWLPGWLAEVKAKWLEKKGAKDDPVPDVSPLLVRFLEGLKAKNPSFTVTNYPGHGGEGGWSDKGHSIDLMLPAQDLSKETANRGFYKRDRAVALLLAADDVLVKLKAQSQVYYNDYEVAAEVNKRAKTIDVDFVGNVLKKYNKMNWHGPAPLGVLHFHLDIIPRA